jgi:transcriptional regulator with XRE-family HTH domain
VGDAQPGGTWGAYLRNLPRRTGKTVQQLAADTGVARGTWYKWMAGTMGINVANVLRVANAAGDPPEVALRAAGGQLLGEDNDPQIRDIIQSGLDDPTKQELIAYVIEERQRAADQIARQVDMMIKARKAS